MHLSSDCASISNLHLSCHPTAEMFCGGSWTPEEIAQNMFLEYSGLANPSTSCYSWCCVSTTLPLAYDKVVCPEQYKSCSMDLLTLLHIQLLYIPVDMEIYCTFSQSPLFLDLLTGNEKQFRVQILLISACCLLARMQKHDGFHFAQVLLHELMPSGTWK